MASNQSNQSAIEEEKSAPIKKTENLIIPPSSQSSFLSSQTEIRVDPVQSFYQQPPSPSMSIESEGPKSNSFSDQNQGIAKLISLYENLNEELLSIKKQQAMQINTLNVLTHDFAAVQKTLSKNNSKKNAALEVIEEETKEETKTSGRGGRKTNKNTKK